MASEHSCDVSATAGASHWEQSRLAYPPHLDLDTDQPNPAPTQELQVVYASNLAASPLPRGTASRSRGSRGSSDCCWNIIARPARVCCWSAQQQRGCRAESHAVQVSSRGTMPWRRGLDLRVAVLTVLTRARASPAASACAALATAPRTPSRLASAVYYPARSWPSSPSTSMF